MAVKIRCSECRKKISVDEAFAGSVCRCPYCKSIVFVPKIVSMAQQGVFSARPSRPRTRPGRPAAPRAKSPGGSGLEHVTGSRPIVFQEGLARPKRPVGPAKIDKPGIPQVHEPKPRAISPDEGQELAPPKIKPVPAAPQKITETVTVDEARLSAEQLAAIPTANPVVLQGMVTLVLIAVLLVMAAACVYLGIRVFGPQQQSESAYVSGAEPEKIVELPNPFMVPMAGPAVCGNIAVQAPVLYCIEAGENMGEIYLYARDVVRASIRSLKDGRKFGVLIAEDGRNVLLGGALHTGGPGGEEALRGDMTTVCDGGKVHVGGAPDLQAGVKTALDLKPATLVLLLSREKIEQPAALGELVKNAGSRLVLVVLGTESNEQKDSYEQAVRAAGGESVLLLYDTFRILQDYYDEKDLPD